MNLEGLTLIKEHNFDITLKNHLCPYFLVKYHVSIYGILYIHTYAYSAYIDITLHYYKKCIDSDQTLDLITSAQSLCKIGASAASLKFGSLTRRLRKRDSLSFHAWPPPLVAGHCHCFPWFATAAGSHCNGWTNKLFKQDTKTTSRIYQPKG